MNQFKYLEYLQSVANAGIALIKRKTQTYGSSWKDRGGRGAWYTLVRPMDRLQKIVEDHQGDIFAAVADGPGGEDGTALASIRDLRNYLVLVEAEMVAQGVVSDPSSLQAGVLSRQGTPEDGAHHSRQQDTDVRVFSLPPRNTGEMDNH